MYLKSYKELIVWQKSMTLVISTYEFTSKFPQVEEFEKSEALLQEVLKMLNSMTVKLKN